MSAPEISFKPSTESRLNVANILIVLALAFITTSATFGFFEGRLVGDIEGVKAKNVEQDQTIERLPRESKEQLEAKLDRDVYEADQKSLEKTLQRIDATVQQIRQDQINDLKAKAEGRTP